jgi:hypothetical protein
VSLALITQAVFLHYPQVLTPGQEYHISAAFLQADAIMRAYRTCSRYACFHLSSRQWHDCGNTTAKPSVLNRRLLHL